MNPEIKIQFIEEKDLYVSLDNFNEIGIKGRIITNGDTYIISVSRNSIKQKIIIKVEQDD